VQPFEIERGLLAFSKYATDDLITGIRRNVFIDLDYELHRIVPRPAVQGDMAPQQELIEYIHLCRRTLEAIILERASGYTAARWLYYFRRLPNFAFLNYQGGLDLYKLSLCDAITGQLATVSDDPDVVNYPLHESVIKRVIRRSQEILYLTNFHVCLHQAAKDVPFQFGNSAIPVPQLRRDVSEALSLFDWRVAAFDQEPLHRLGTQAHSEISTERLERVFAIIARRKETEWVRNPQASNGTAGSPKILANYGVRFVDLEKLSDLILDGRIASPVWTKEAGALLLLSRISAEMFVSPLFYRHVAEVGHVVTDKETLLEMFATLFKGAEEAVHRTAPDLHIPTDPESLLRELEDMRGSTWPIVPGPVVRSTRGTIYLDLASASLRLNRAFEFPRETGASANARAEHFEHSVQLIVDSSPWANIETRRLRGRILRQNNKHITDIDAVGAKGRRLLLISCKSILYSEYEIADFRVLRNATDTLQKAVVVWSRVCSLLRNNRVGDNYDFSSFDEIIGVICTPVVVYTPLGIATSRVADGLYAAVSMSELRLWLDGQSLERK